MTGQPSSQRNDIQTQTCCSTPPTSLALPEGYDGTTCWNAEEALICANKCELQEGTIQEQLQKALADICRLKREHEQLPSTVALNQPVDSPAGLSSPGVHKTSATTFSVAVAVQATPADAIDQELTPTAPNFEEPFSNGCSSLNQLNRAITRGSHQLARGKQQLTLLRPSQQN